MILFQLHVMDSGVRVMEAIIVNVWPTLSTPCNGFWVV